MADDQPEVVIVDDHGQEHVFPPGFDPKRAAEIVRARGGASAPLSRQASAKTGDSRGTLAGQGLSPDTGLARDTAPYPLDEFAGGVAENFNPMNYVNALKYLFTTDPRESIPAIAKGTVNDVGNLIAGDARTAGRTAGGFLIGPTLGAAGSGLRRAAPALMESGLTRTMAQKLEFPGTPQRLVDEGIVARGSNVQDALTATEGQVNAAAQAGDAAHPIFRVDPDTNAQYARDFAHTEGRVGGLGNVPGPESAELDQLVQKYLDANTRTRSLQETIDQKRAYGARARYNNRPNAPVQTNEAANFNKGMASANRNAAIALSPELEALLSKEQDLLGALAAQQYHEVRNTPIASLDALKSVAGLRNPTIMGNAAIAADRTGRMLQTVDPQAVRAALLRLMASHAVDNAQPQP